MSPSGVTIVVPARLNSTRLPNKLLLNESGKSLLAHTLTQCLKAKNINRVIAAVDCPELAEIATQTGAENILTSPDIASGSDRIWEAIREDKQISRIINVQGDEPEISPLAIDLVAKQLLKGTAVVTLAAPLPKRFERDPASVKVFSDTTDCALDFCRLLTQQKRNAINPRLHIGIYGYQRNALAAFAKSKPSKNELERKLEQLRFLALKIPIKVLPWEQAFPGIDTRTDYDAFLGRVKRPPSPSS